MMDLSLDTQSDSTDDVSIINGDFVTAESTYQHQRQLLLNDKGAFKENPTICVGAFGYLDNEGVATLSRDAGKEFVRDGMKVNNIQISQPGKLDIDAYYP